MPPLKDPRMYGFHVDPIYFVAFVLNNFLMLSCLPSSPYLSRSAPSPASTPPPFLVMERSSSTIHFDVLACVPFAILLILALLFLQYTRMNSLLGLCRESQTKIMIMKFMLDLALVILYALIISKTIILKKDIFKVYRCLRLLY